MLTAPIVTSLLCSYTATICTYMLAALTKIHSCMEPACSRHRSSLCFVHPSLYARACSRHSFTSLRICSLYAHGTTYLFYFVCSSPLYMRLYAHGIRQPRHFHTFCILAAPLIISFLLCLSTPTLYASACSWYLSTSHHTCSLHAHVISLSTV